MYIAIVRMDTPVFDHDMVVKVSLSSTDKFAAMKDKGLLMKYYLSRESGGSGGVYIWKSKEDADAWYTPEWSARLEKLTAQSHLSSSMTLSSRSTIRGTRLLSTVKS